METTLDRLARQVVHHVEVQAVALVDVMHGDDVGMVQHAEGAGLVDELLRGGDCPQPGPQHLDSNGPVEPHVAGEEHRPHAAARQLALDVVAFRRQGGAHPLQPGGHREFPERELPGRQP